MKTSRKAYIENLVTLSSDEINTLTKQKDETSAHIKLSAFLIKNPRQQAKLKSLEKRLLAIGGTSVVLPNFEEDIRDIMTHGQLWTTKPVLMKGRPSQCHKNSCDLWYENKTRATICTGYALSDDGLWRQHSWLIHLRPNTNTVIETTTPRLAYYGFAMTYAQCCQFDDDN